MRSFVIDNGVKWEWIEIRELRVGDCVRNGMGDRDLYGIVRMTRDGMALIAWGVGPDMRGQTVFKESNSLAHVYVYRGNVEAE